MKTIKNKRVQKELSHSGCDHQSFTRKFVLGEPSQDYVCVHCGKLMSKLGAIHWMRH